MTRNMPNAHMLPEEMADKGLPAPTDAQVAAAARLNHPLNLALAWMHDGCLYVGTHDPTTDGTRCAFVIHPNGDTYNTHVLTCAHREGAPLPVVGIGPAYSHPVTLMVDYVGAIPGAEVMHTGGGCMAVEVYRPEWDARGFGLSMADEGGLPGDTLGAGYTEEGVAFYFGTVPSYAGQGADHGPADAWDGVYEGCFIAPDPVNPGGWPTPSRVAEIMGAYGDAIAAMLEEQGAPADHGAASEIARRAGVKIAAAFPEVSTY
jgi:hypothetical protein